MKFCKGFPGLFLGGGGFCRDGFMEGFVGKGFLFLVVFGQGILIWSFNPIRSGGWGLKDHPTKKFALTHLILELHYCGYDLYSCCIVKPETIFW